MKEILTTPSHVTDSEVANTSRRQSGTPQILCVPTQLYRHCKDVQELTFYLEQDLRMNEPSLVSINYLKLAFFQPVTESS